jgi:Ca2+-binding RTX toxin-like protein
MIDRGNDILVGGPGNDTLTEGLEKIYSFVEQQQTL